MILAGHGGRSMAAFGAKTTAARGAAWDAIAQQEEQLRIRDATVARVRRQAPAAVAAIVADALAYAICAPSLPPTLRWRACWQSSPETILYRSSSSDGAAGGATCLVARGLHSVSIGPHWRIGRFFPPRWSASAIPTAGCGWRRLP